MTTPSYDGLREIVERELRSWKHGALLREISSNDLGSIARAMVRALAPLMDPQTVDEVAEKIAEGQT